uniref:Uncharacterized protein n=1 Tax=Florenciella sp. virus SA2 TaxID=3240092 RepID=A0AB39JB30_9VIRU
MKFFNLGALILTIISYYTYALIPNNLPSGKKKKYNPNNEHPEKDLKKIKPSEASFISRHWLNNILQSKQICQEDEYILHKINHMEQFIQDQYTFNEQVYYEYLAWCPQGITTDVLFLVIVEKKYNKIILRLLINSPFWECSQISNDYLLKSLKQYTNLKRSELDLTDFLNENFRYKLDWENFKLNYTNIQ